MPILIVILPLLGSIVSGFGGRYLGAKGSGRIATICMFFTLFLVVYTFFKVGIKGETFSIIAYSWVNSELFNVSFGFLFDPLTDRKSTRLNSSHVRISYAVFCLKK